MQVVEVALNKLKPYKNNPRKNDEAVEKVAASIYEFGFKVPLVIDNDGVIVTGHTRYKAAQALGLVSVPCVVADDLTPEQVKAFRLVDNRVGEIADWDLDLLAAELKDITEIDLEEFAFDPVSDTDFFSSDYHGGAERQEGNDDYNEFLDKFEIPKTTDDCYTPAKVYDAVADWVSAEYGVDRKRFVRPFYPGGDYQKEKYKADSIVVDNPPFSILSEILKFYDDKKIKFFMFCPALTAFSSSSSSSSACVVGTGADVVYENKASVSTSFVTNLEKDRFRSAPDLYACIKKAMDEVLKETRRYVPRYSYPDEVVTSTMLSNYSKYGVDFRASREETAHVRQLDSQKDTGKAIFGSGYLLSQEKAAEKAAAEKAAAEKAAAEKAAAEVWELSDREREIVEKLSGGQKNMEN